MTGRIVVQEETNFSSQIVDICKKTRII